MRLTRLRSSPRSKFPSNEPPAVPRLRWSAFALALTAAALAGLLAVTPTPFWLIGPGNAVDLSTRVAVVGYAPPRDRYYLTDVTVTRASALLLAEGLAPGIRVVREDALVPRGESPLLYDRLLADAMRESFARTFRYDELFQSSTCASQVMSAPQAMAGHG